MLRQGRSCSSTTCLVSLSQLQHRPWGAHSIKFDPLRRSLFFLVMFVLSLTFPSAAQRDAAGRHTSGELYGYRVVQERSASSR